MSRAKLMPTRTKLLKLLAKKKKIVFACVPECKKSFDRKSRL